MLTLCNIFLLTQCYIVQSTILLRLCFATADQDLVISYSFKPAICNRKSHFSLCPILYILLIFPELL